VFLYRTTIKDGGDFVKGKDRRIEIIESRMLAFDE
jgi:hypothetical protein